MEYKVDNPHGSICFPRVYNAVGLPCCPAPETPLTEGLDVAWGFYF